MKIVCIGGGHGLAQVLSAIKPMCKELTAIVATTDNGGSTGRIREAYGCIALGDIRRCCIQLAKNNTDNAAIYDHRFEGGDLDGHSLGNLTLLAFLQSGKCASEAIHSFNKMLGNNETVLPMSDFPTDIIAELHNGEHVFGECAIDALGELPKKIFLSHDVPASSKAVEAILSADFIIMGPGSIISSVMPSFLVKELGDAIHKTSACRLFIENSADENSVMKTLKCAGIDWLQEQLGQKIYDLSISPQAMQEILYNGEKVENQNSHLHDISELKMIFSELLKNPFIDSD